MSIRQMRRHHLDQKYKKTWSEKINDDVSELMERLDVPMKNRGRAQYLFNSIINQEILRINDMFSNLKPKKTRWMKIRELLSNDK